MRPQKGALSRVSVTELYSQLQVNYLQGIRTPNGPQCDITCLWGSNKVRLKPVSSASENSKKIETLFVTSFAMIYGLAGWSAAFLIANPEDIFSCAEAQIKENVHGQI